MARKNLKPEATSEKVLECVQKQCPECGSRMWNEYNNIRHLRTMKGVLQLRLKIHRCQNMSCQRYRIAYRPEQEGSWVLPHHEFGLDVIALVGALAQEKIVKEINNNIWHSNRKPNRLRR